MSSDSALTETAETRIREADVAGFAAKLEAWYETLPVCEIHGDILAKYNDVRGWNSGLGLPQCDVSGLGDGKGLYSVFAYNNSAIVSHPDTGPRVIQGAIHNAWVNMGSDTGPLGYPTT